MPSGTFDRSVRVQQRAADSWEVLTDVNQVAGWVSVVGSVDEVEPLGEYAVVLTDSFGPFDLNADVSVEVLDVAEGRSIHFKGSGKDRQVKTSISVDARMELEEHGDETEIRVHGTWNVLGTVATMGSGTIRNKADKIVEEFFSAAESALS